MFIGWEECFMNILPLLKDFSTDDFDNPSDNLVELVAQVDDFRQSLNANNEMYLGMARRLLLKKYFRRKKKLFRTR